MFMAMPDGPGEKKPLKPTPLLRVAIIFGVVSTGLAAGAVGAMMHVLEGGRGWGIAGLVVAAMCYGLTGYFLWGYRYLIRQQEQRPGSAGYEADDASNGG